MGVTIDYTDPKCGQSLKLMTELQSNGYSVFSTKEEAKDFLKDKIERKISWLNYTLDKLNAA